MPGLTGRLKRRVFLLRVVCVGLGTAAAYGFMWLTLVRTFIHDAKTVQTIMFVLIAIGATVGEFFARKTLKCLGRFPANRPIPLTF